MNQQSSFLLWPAFILVHKTGKVFQNSVTTLCTSVHVTFPWNLCAHLKASPATQGERFLNELSLESCPWGWESCGLIWGSCRLLSESKQRGTGAEHWNEFHGAQTTYRGSNCNHLQGFVSSCRSFEPRTLSWVSPQTLHIPSEMCVLFQSLQGESCGAQRDLWYTLERSY